MILTRTDGTIINLLYCKLVKKKKKAKILQRHIEHYHSSLSPFFDICSRDLYNAPNQVQDFWIQTHFLSKAGIFPQSCWDTQVMLSSLLENSLVFALVM